MEIDKLGPTKKEEKGERKRKKIINSWKKKGTRSRQSILFFWGFFWSWMSPRTSHGEMHGNLFPKENSYLKKKKCCVQNPDATLQPHPQPHE